MSDIRKIAEKEAGLLCGSGPYQEKCWECSNTADAIERAIREAISLPPHKAGLYLTHNEHKDYYETAEQWISARENREQMPDWSSPDARQRCIDTNEVWVLHWYPTSPVGFEHVAGPTLEEVLEAARRY